MRVEKPIVEGIVRVALIRGRLTDELTALRADAIYRHLPNKAAVVSGLVERVFTQMATGPNRSAPGSTLRKDGSPRISGTEIQFDDGEISLGMMGGSVKLLDARRDPRVAIHSPTIEPSGEPSS